MSDVRQTYITAEVAERLGISTSYLLRLVKETEFTPDELRSAGKRTHLFSEKAIAKLQTKLSNLRS